MDKGEIMKPKQEWKPKVNERYWTIERTMDGFSIDNFQFTSVNDNIDYREKCYFRTRELARKALKEVKKVLKNSRHS